MTFALPALRVLIGILALSVILDGIFFQRDLVHLLVLHSLFLLLLALAIFVLERHNLKQTPTNGICQPQKSLLE